MHISDMLSDKQRAIDVEIVKDFVSGRWSDQKIAEVLAFAQDGKMSAGNACCCIIGVHSSQNLHLACFERHYGAAKHKEPSITNVEFAYMRLGCYVSVNQVMINILSEVMAEREANRITAPELEHAFA